MTKAQITQMPRQQENTGRTRQTGRQRRCFREPSTYLLRGISCVYGGSVVFADQDFLSTGDQLGNCKFLFILFKKIQSDPQQTNGTYIFTRPTYLTTGDQLFSKGYLDARKNGPDRRGRRVRCGPAGRPAPGR